VQALNQKGLYLEYFTVAYKLVEAALSILLGNASNSIALIGFGWDRLVESLSKIVAIWRQSNHETFTPAAVEKFSRRAVKLLAIAFFVLAGYILFECVRKLNVQESPQASVTGVVMAAISMIVMPILAYYKYEVGNEINSQALISDAKETILSGSLAVALWFGLGLNYLFGFWQADIITGFIIVFYLVKAGWKNWHGNDD
jgi:divalent metal cation (Fe/Co/Zn/Cd) transporter